MVELEYKLALQKALLAAHHGKHAEKEAAIKEAISYERRLAQGVRDRIRKETEAWNGAALADAPACCELQGVYSTKEEAEAAMAAAKRATGGAKPCSKSHPPCRGAKSAGKKAAKKSAVSAAVARVEESVLTANPVDGGPDAWHCPDCDSAQAWDEMCHCGWTCDD